MLSKSLKVAYQKNTTPPNKLKKDLECCITEVFSERDNSSNNLQKPPKHPQKIHLPNIKSPSSVEKKPKFSILMSPNSNSSMESSIGDVKSSLTPNHGSSIYDNFLNASASYFLNNSSESLEENEKTDIEKIIDEQHHFEFQLAISTRQKIV